MAGQEKVARTRFCFSGCGEAVLVFLQLLAKEIACGGRGGGVRGVGLRRLRLGAGCRVWDLTGRAGWAAGQEKVARTRFCFSGCGL